MANYLFAYNLSGSTGNTIGVNELVWNERDLSGNTPFAIATTSTLSGYSNISSIVNWDAWGEAAGYSRCKVRNEIKSLYESDTGTTWSGYSVNEQKVLSRYFLVDKAKRDEVYTDAEQEEYNYYKIYNFLADDAFERLGTINPKATPKSIDYKKDVNQRLHPEYDYDIYGFLTGVTYYENLDVTQISGITIFNFDNPILRYEAAYSQGSDGYVTNRVVTRMWQTMDNEWSTDVKTSVKIYNTNMSRMEGNRRRRNLINNLLIDTVGLFFMTSTDPVFTSVSETESHALHFLEGMGSGIQMYYEAGPKLDSQGNPCQLIQQISASTYSNLDNTLPSNTGMTIRQYIIYRLNP